MAHKRMFSKTIIETDAFQDMSQTAQLLYFYLNMQADDDGFVGNPKRIMRAGGFAEDDFKVLLAKRFLLAFENGVVVIKHWLIHNTIRKDRYVETSYKKEKEALYIKENKAYTDNGNQLATKGLPRIDIGEDRKGENINTEQSSELEYIPLEEEIKKVAKKTKTEKPWNSQNYINSLINSKREDLKIMGHYMKIKKMNFPTKKSAEAEFGRNIRSARELSDYSKEKRTVAVNKAAKMTKEWSLLTVCKYLNK